MHQELGDFDFFSLIPQLTGYVILGKLLMYLECHFSTVKEEVIPILWALVGWHDQMKLLKGQTVKKWK